MIAPSRFQSGMCFRLSQLSADSKHKCDHQNAHISTFTFFKKKPPLYGKTKGATGSKKAEETYQQ